MQLQQVGGILDSSLAEFLTRAQVLTAHKATSSTVAAVATNGRPSRQEGWERASQTPPPGRERVSKTPPPGSGGFRGKCFECGGPTRPDIARRKLQEPYGVIAVGGRDTLLCTAVRGRGRETSRGKLLRQQLSIPKSEGAYRPTHNRGSGGGREVRALVDTGCTTTMVRFNLVGERVGESWMSAFDGRKMRCGRERPVNLEVRGTPVEVSAVAIEHLDVVLGMDVIEQLGGRDGQEQQGGFRGGTMPDGME